MKLPSGYSIGSFYTSHFISIIRLSITALEGWNLRLVDESERNTANFIWVISRGSAACYFADISWQPTNQIARDCCADVRGWSVSCREIGIEFQSNRVSFDGFLFEPFMKTLRESTHSLIPTPRQAKEAFSTVDVSGFVPLWRNAFREERYVHVNANFNQTWRPLILRMLWLQCVWLCAEQRSERMQTAEHVSWPNLVFVQGQKWTAEIVSFVQYPLGFHWERARCEYSYFVVF